MIAPGFGNLLVHNTAQARAYHRFLQRQQSEQQQQHHCLVFCYVTFGEKERKREQKREMKRKKEPKKTTKAKKIRVLPD